MTPRNYIPNINLKKGCGSDAIYTEHLEHYNDVIIPLFVYTL
jgi:hypothetical protein